MGNSAGCARGLAGHASGRARVASIFPPPFVFDRRQRRVPRRVFVGFLRQFRLALEHGVQPLDGADDDVRDRVELVAGETLDVVELREQTTVVRRAVALELLERLLA